MSPERQRQGTRVQQRHRISLKNGSLVKELYMARRALAREEATCLLGLVDLIVTTTAASKGALPWLKLARFGDVKTPLVQKSDDKWTGGSLRHNANLKVCIGIEADYD